MGIPPSYRRGECETTYNSLIYSITLSHAVDFCSFLHRPDTAREYRNRAAAVNAAVNQYCFSASLNLYPDGPVTSSTDTDICQVFAILANAISRPPASELIRLTLYPTEYPEVFIQHALLSPARCLQSRRVRRAVPQPGPALAKHGRGQLNHIGQRRCHVPQRYHR